MILGLEEPGVLGGLVAIGWISPAPVSTPMAKSKPAAPIEGAPVGCVPESVPSIPSYTATRSAISRISVTLTTFASALANFSTLAFMISVIKALILSSLFL